MPAEALEVTDLRAGYGQTVVLEHLSLSVGAGERVAILGRNGMGKSTLLGAVMGLNKRYGGVVRIGARDVTGLDTASRAMAGIGLVPQTREIFSSLTVEENLRVGLKGRSRHCVAEAYRMFPRLEERKGNLGWQLSGGEQQMLSTARTILGRPSVLLLDEPLEGLAPVACDEFMEALSRLAIGGDMTVLIVEQRLEAALTFADRALILERGRICWQGPCDELTKNHEIVERHIGVGSLH